jgi:hypothetical protein
VSLVTADGTTLCDPPETCPVCGLFTDQRPDESRQDWLARIGVAYRGARGKQTSRHGRGRTTP